MSNPPLSLSLSLSLSRGSPFEEVWWSCQSHLRHLVLACC
jgi:hypothetical protein